MSAKIVSLLAVATCAFAGGAFASPGAGRIASPDGSAIYMVSPDAGSTVITKLRGSDRTAVWTGRLPGSFEVPAVAGVDTGLSHDGSTLVLGGHPAAHVSQFAVIDTETLGVRRVLSLKGTYSFDAMSPDASQLYVIRFLSQDGTRYAVQGLDLNARRPVARTLVEKGEPGERMAGQAMTRATSADGAWVYTLYDGAEGEPFVHALSTVDAITVCIDLDALAGRDDLRSLTLLPGVHSLDVIGKDGSLATINTDTFEVTDHAVVPAAAPTAAPAAPAEGGKANDFPWRPIAAVALLAAAAATLARRRLSGALRARG